MKFLSKYKLHIKIIAMVLVVCVAGMIIPPPTSYAGEYDVDLKTGADMPDYHGDNNTDEEFYIWHRVKDVKDPMFTYLSDGLVDGQYNKEYTENGKTFRVMMFIGPERRYVPADWTRLRINKSGTAGWTRERNSQQDTSKDTFITMGAQRSFICDYEMKWSNGKGKYSANDKLPEQYLGMHRYHFYFSDRVDRNPQCALVYAHSYLDPDIYAYDKDGMPWGSTESTSSNIYKASYYSQGSKIFVDTWAVVKNYDGYTNMRLVAYNHTKVQEGDYDLGFDAFNNLTYVTHAAKWSDVILYVGEPCPVSVKPMITNNSDTKSDSVGAGMSRVIDSPMIIRKDETFFVQENAVLFVDSLLVLRGTLVNNGIIIVEPGGAIVSWDNGLGQITSIGGDVIVRDKGMVFVNTYMARTQITQLYQPLYARNINIYNGVIDMRKKEVSIKGAEKLKNYSFISLEKTTDNLYRIKLDASKFALTGNASSNQIGNDVAKYKVDK